ncbi:hypothetical protein [Tatumella ptyseos]|uniref:hypothetical protein n=1 Tax=Tatumella ptyseos TaxID=82987 RepID=UPI0026F07C7E|nr:hypothetical protein [Tatumella ptyseos]WKX27332.1 hypothetical protein QJR74_04095 [Tatumella ptyseos]
MSLCSAARAATAQCAEIKFSLSLQASFERQACDARLTLHNASPLPLTDVKVELRFLDTQLQPVLASIESVSSQASFLLVACSDDGFIYGYGSARGDAALAINSDQKGAVSATTRDYLAAKVSYIQGESREEFDIQPITIVVKPLKIILIFGLRKIGINLVLRQKKCTIQYC